MAENPYAPPSAQVADVDAGQPLPRPREVKTAILLFWISVVVALPTWMELGGMDTDDPEALAAVLFGWIFALAMMAFTIWVIVCIGRARNWARIVYLVLATLGWLMMLAELPGLFTRPWYFWSGYLANSALDLAIVVLLFMPASNAWFRVRGRGPADAT